MKKIELLAPAGDIDKLETVFDAGADAAYIGGAAYSLRAKTAMLDKEVLKYCADLAHKNNKKLYLTLNIVAHNRHIKGMLDLARFAKDVGFGAVIVSDPGVLFLINEHKIGIDVHISTQANISNCESVSFYARNGAKRVNLARELTLEEIKEIRENNKSVELETFIHGAMCVAYSGRCLVSRYMTNRSGNLGGCSHSCRFNYSVVSIKDKITGKEMDMVEEDEATEILASEDMITINILKEIIDTGVDSLKIEGRTKSISYLTTVVSTYRKAIDNIAMGKDEYYAQHDLELLNQLSPRGVWGGFYKSDATEDYLKEKKKGQIVAGYIRLKKTDKVLFDVKMPFNIKDELYAYSPNFSDVKVDIEYMEDFHGNKVECANPNELLWVKFSKNLPKATIIRKYINWS